MPPASSPTRILFVCMGNICRSPAAEGVMQHMIDEAGLGNEVQVDSAGTIGMHAGNPPDSRMRKAASRRGYTLNHAARQLRPSDLEAFDLVLVMDEFNLADANQLAGGAPRKARMHLFCEYCTEHDHTEVPDPYYGGPEGFEEVLNLLEDGCAELVRRLQNGTLLAR
ncbi:protein tyrosine phosphatase [Roseimicrobium gellanilyticum]|uniref:Protein tyrosine phosphatase n=1 Tax=Roseimicrobium gellanilyticum TaxID=748857 RepID=A0A366HT71_9BACT|nr:low molecular weight protein-tyrosine-phosphatase [Roseimicrobium gellanilyticum]RBP46298.1 protein tyrosine phosphatase [Roseimicrobium gellanilyticum]